MKNKIRIAAALVLTTTSALADTAGPAPKPDAHGPNLSGFFSPFPFQGGEAVYKGVCKGCHMADAKGAVGAGYYPALAGNQKLASATYPALVVLKGRHGMPAFADYLTDAQVVEVVNYVRSHFGNQYPDALTQAEVAKLR